MKVQIQRNPGKPTLIEGMVGKDLWILCDKCGEPITEINLGLVTVDPYQDLPATPNVHFFHKGKCDPGTPKWTELRIFLALLQGTPQD